MGAAGDAFLCENGHLVSWTDSGDLWSGRNFDRLKEKMCPCGAKSRFHLCHYGSINDCLEPDSPLIELPSETFDGSTMKRFDVKRFIGTIQDITTRPVRPVLDDF